MGVTCQPSQITHRTANRSGTSGNSSQIGTRNPRLRWAIESLFYHQTHLSPFFTPRPHPLRLYSSPFCITSRNEPDDGANSPRSPMSILLDPTALASSSEFALATPTSLPNDTLADASADQEILGTSSQAIIACNSISVAASLLVIVIYGLLHRKYTRIMQRTSLVLSCAMATADLLLHVSGPLIGI